METAARRLGPMMKNDPTTTPRHFGEIPEHTRFNGDKRDRGIPDVLLEWLGTAAPRSRIVRIAHVELNRDCFWNMLAPEEREHLSRCRSDRRRLELMGSRGAAKMIIQDYVREWWNAELAHESIRVAKRPSGSPFIVVPMPHSAAGGPPRLSLSHNRTYCWAALVGDRFRIGVDVQEIQPRIQRLASYFLVDSEREIILNARAAEGWGPDAGYTAAWSAKEAAFKCVGRKVSFRKFCVEAHVARMDEYGTVLIFGSSNYFVHQIRNSKNVFSVLSTTEARSRSAGV